VIERLWWAPGIYPGQTKTEGLQPGSDWGCWLKAACFFLEKGHMYLGNHSILEGKKLSSFQ